MVYDALDWLLVIVGSVCVCTAVFALQGAIISTIAADRLVALSLWASCILLWGGGAWMMMIGLSSALPWISQP